MISYNYLKISLNKQYELIFFKNMNVINLYLVLDHNVSVQW